MLAEKGLIKRKSLFIMLSMWFVVFFLFVMLQAVSPVLPLIVEDLQLNYLWGGILYSIPLAVIVFLSYPLGLLSDRIGVERSVICGMLIAVTLGFLRGFSNSLGLLFFTTLLYGTGLTQCFVSMPKFVKKYFPSNLFAIATGVYTSAIPFGAGTGISVTRPLSGFLGLGWQGVFWLWSLAAVPFLLIWTFLVLNAQKAYNQKNAFPQNRSLSDQFSSDAAGLQSGTGLRNNLKVMITGGVLFFLLNLFFYCISGWLPTFLEERNWDSGIAALVTSAVPYAEVPAILISPFFSQSRMQKFIISGFLGIAVSTFVIVLFPVIAWPACLVLGISFGAVFPLLLSLPAKIPALGDDTGRASGMLLSIGYLGPLAGVPMLGFFRDLYGGFIPGFILLICLALLAAIYSLRLPNL